MCDNNHQQIQCTEYIFEEYQFISTSSLYKTEWVWFSQNGMNGDPSNESALQTHDPLQLNIHRLEKEDDVLWLDSPQQRINIEGAFCGNRSHRGIHYRRCLWPDWRQLINPLRRLMHYNFSVVYLPHKYCKALTWLPAIIYFLMAKLVSPPAPLLSVFDK
jgi:hypothetical protein